MQERSLLPAPTRPRFPGRGIKRVMDTHIFEPLPKRAGMQPVFSRPLGNRLSLSEEGNLYCRAGVVVLLTACRPLAIVWAISLIVVYSLNRMPFGGPIAHVRDKILKRIHPPIADGYSPSSITMIRLMCRGVAPVFHRLPNCVDFGSMHPVSFCSCRHAFFLETPARFGSPAPKCVTSGYCRSSAVAKAEPANAATFVFCSRNNGESAKATTTKIVYFLRHHYLELRNKWLLSHALTVAAN